MSLKNLLFPLVAIISVFLLFAFIKPAVSDLFGHVEEKKAKLADLDAVEKTSDNIGVLSKEYLMLSGDGTVSRIIHRLPESSGQDRIVGMVHRAAEQSGVIVSNLSFEEKELQQEPVFVADPAVEMLPAIPIPPTLSDPKLFSATVKVNGSYEGIKSFFGVLSGMEQLNRVSAFSVGHTAASPGEENTQPGGVLDGSLSVDFLYLPSDPSEYMNGYLLPVFSRNSFDMSAAEASLKMAESTDVIAPAISGRPNPFLP